MRRRRGSATILSRKQILTGLAAIAIAVVATLPQGPALAEWKDTPSATAGTPTAPARGIFGSGALESRGLEMVSQWNRVVDRLPKLSAALTACAADPVQCTAPWMSAWLQARQAAAGLEHSEQLREVIRFFNRWPYKSVREI